VDGSYTSLYRCASTWALRIASAAFAPREDADATSFASPRNRSLFHRRIFRCDGPCFRDLPFVAVEVCPLSGICQKNSKQMQNVSVNPTLVQATNPAFWATHATGTYPGRYHGSDCRSGHRSDRDPTRSAAGQWLVFYRWQRWLRRGIFVVGERNASELVRVQR
jgi:hypothetical protein